MVAGLGACPRDGTRLRVQADGYPNCIHCGYEDYTYALPKRRRDNAAGLMAQIRYIGFAAHLMELTITVRAKRHQQSTSGIVTVPSCPWDAKDMKAVPRNGFGKEKDERTYRCGRRHKIILLSSANGDWRGWM